MRPSKVHFFQVGARNSICGQPEYCVKQINRTDDKEKVTCSNCLKTISRLDKLDTNAVFRDLVTLKGRFGKQSDWKSVTIIQNAIKYMTELEGRLGIENLAALQERFMPVVIPKSFERERWLRVCKVFVDNLGIKPEECKPDSDIIEDLGADSLDTVELVMGLEEEFSIQIPDEEAEGVTTLGKAYETVTKLLS